MLKIRRILFPTDYSASAEHAFGHAVHLADYFDAELHVVHVTEEPGTGDALARYQRHPAVRKVAMRPSTGRVRPDAAYDDEGVQLVQADVRGASVAAVILDYAREYDADLIVMGTHGRRGLRRVMGSVAMQVVREAGCPVFTVRASDEHADAETIRRVLVPIDFSASSKESLRHARALAPVYRATIDVLHVVDASTLPETYGLEAASLGLPEVLSTQEEALGAWVAEAGLDGARVHVVPGRAGRSIVQVARDLQADLIVIGTHGRSAIRRVLLGSVAEQVIRAAPCPVFTVKPLKRSLIEEAEAGRGPGAD